MSRPAILDAFSSHAFLQRLDDRCLMDLASGGLIVANPPWTLERDMAAMAPALGAVLGTEGDGRFRIGARNF